ncbi:MAG: FecR domain-containing protein [Terriglobia bacterium]
MKRKISSLLDQAIAEIRNQKIAPESIDESARRVWSRLNQAGDDNAAGESIRPLTAATGGPIRGCVDFQAGIPAYLAGNLSEARALLFEDHTRECVACRQALHRARYGVIQTAAPVVMPPKRKPSRKLVFGGALAAVVLALIVVSGVDGVLPSLISGKGSRLTVESVQGELYAVSSQSTRPVGQGVAIQAGHEIRTAAHSTAVIRLAHGSLIEMSERADVSVTPGWLGTTIHLAQGTVIIEASQHDSGRLSVETRDCLISDRGTIFAVSAGVKGSRVSVIQGEVRVKEGGRAQVVRAGGQLSTSASLTSSPIRDQISWSPNATRYLGLMSELAGIGRELQSIPGPAPRFESQLIGYVPENTVIYAAIPNLESTLKNVDLLFQDRLAKSVLLQQWWQKQQASGAAMAAEEILQRVEACSSYLGNEIVFAGAESGSSGKLRPIVLAQVEKPGFRAFLEQQLSEVNAQMGHSGFRIVDDASSLSPAAGDHQIVILLKNNVMATASDPQELREIAARISTGRPSGFAATDFYSSIQHAYRSGAGWLLAANVEQIAARSVQKKQAAETPSEPKGSRLANVKYLFAESKEVHGKPENRLTVTFAGERQGLASLLAPPSPMGTLDFVSPEASFAMSFVLRDPKTLIEQFLGPASQRNAKIKQGLDLFESETGVSVENDLAGSLGGEITLAQDGPLLPTPQWLAVMDVYNPASLETSIEKLVKSFNEKLGGIAGTLRLTQEERAGRVYYTLSVEPSTASTDQATGGPPRQTNLGKLAGLSELHYTFADGYLLVGSSQSGLARAIENRDTGYSLTRSQEFQAQLPEDGNAYFSALLYENLGAKLRPLLQELQGTSGLPAGGDKPLEDLVKNATPVMIGAYGEPVRIMVVSNESPLGLGLNSILGAAGAMLRRPAAHSGQRGHNSLLQF